MSCSILLAWGSAAGLLLGETECVYFAGRKLLFQDMQLLKRTGLGILASRVAQAASRIKPASSINAVRNVTKRILWSLAEHGDDWGFQSYPNYVDLRDITSKTSRKVIRRPCDFDTGCCLAIRIPNSFSLLLTE